MRTWSYTIMGCSQAFYYWSYFFDILEDEEEVLEKFPDSKVKDLIEEKYERLVSFAIELKSRLAFQVLGVLLMNYGAKLTNALRKLILIYSRWEDEKDQLFDEKDRLERFYYLSEFRKTIKSYKGGIPTKIPWEWPSQIIEKLREQGEIETNYPFIISPDRTPISHSLKKKEKSKDILDNFNFLNL